MRYIQWFFCAGLLSFLVGLIYSTQFKQEQEPLPNLSNSSYVVDKPLTAPTSYNVDDPNLLMPAKPDVDSTTDLKPCSKTNTMPCEISPRDPLKEELDSKVSRPGLFKVGEEITCIYPAVYSTAWSDGKVEEDIKTIPMVCRVIKASEPWDDIEPNYQHVQVDCSKDLAEKSSDQPGVGLVKDHKLNYKQRWFTSNDCYHFVQH